MLTHRGIDAWLVDDKHQRLAHSAPTVEGNKINAEILDVRPNLRYSFQWRCTPTLDSKKISAYCQIYTPNVRGNAQKPRRVAQTSMDETNEATQTRSSVGHLILPLLRHDHLTVPKRNGPSSVWLEIRRAQGSIEEIDIVDPKDDTKEICEIDVDMIDDPEENKMPWIIFHFDFNSINANSSPTSTSSQMSATSPVVARSSLDSDDGPYPQRTRLQRKQAAAGSSGPVEKKAPRIQMARARALPIPKSLKPNQRSTQASLPVPIIMSSPMKERPSAPQPQAGSKRRRASESSLSSSPSPSERPSERPSVSPTDESDLEGQLEALKKEESELRKKVKKKISDRKKKNEKLRRLL